MLHEMNDVKIRIAAVEDTQRILEIYEYYVRNTAITFEYEVPTAEEFRQRIKNTLKKYPYLVAVRDERIVGYAYAGAFHPRAAYAWCAELTIYLDHTAVKGGIGGKLYDALERALREMGIKNLYACIGDPQVEDEYLTKNSEQFHAHLGFTKIGEFHKCGYKFGRWYNMIWMEKIIGEHEEQTAKVRSFSEIEGDKI